MIYMASQKYIPAVIKYTKILADSINSIKAADIEADISVQTGLLKECSALLVQAKDALGKLQNAVEDAAKKANYIEKAIFFKNDVFPLMEELRRPIDQLEVITDKELWPVPTYGDLLFEL